MVQAGWQAGCAYRHIREEEEEEEEEEEFGIEPRRRREGAQKAVTNMMQADRGRGRGLHAEMA